MPSLKNSAPDIQVSAVSLDFGDVKSGGTKTKTFEIRNLGGSDPDISVKWDNKPSWANFSLDKNSQGSFPMTVTVTVNAVPSLIDGSYNANLIVHEGRTTYAGVTAFMNVKGSTARVSPPSAAPIAPRPQPTSRPALIAGSIGVAGMFAIGFLLFVFVFFMAIANSGGFATATEVPYVPPTDTVYVDPYADILNEVYNQVQMSDNSTVYCADASDPCRLYGSIETTLYNNSTYDITLHNDGGCKINGSSDTSYDWYMNAGSETAVTCPIVYDRNDNSYSLNLRIIYPQYGPDQSSLDMLFWFTVE